MQAGHFWIFSSRLVLACLQTGCGKSTQKSLKTACTFISLDLFSVSLAVMLLASCSSEQGVVERYLDALIAGKDTSAYTDEGFSGLQNGSWAGEAVALNAFGLGKPQILSYSILNAVGDVVTVQVFLKKTSINPLRGYDQHLFVTDETIETYQFQIKNGKISKVF